jgi:hypothetical protein
VVLKGQGVNKMNNEYYPIQNKKPNNEKEEEK